MLESEFWVLGLNKTEAKLARPPCPSLFFFRCPKYQVEWQELPTQPSTSPKLLQSKNLNYLNKFWSSPFSPHRAAASYNFDTTEAMRMAQPKRTRPSNLSGSSLQSISVLSPRKHGVHDSKSCEAEIRIQLFQKIVETSQKKLTCHLVWTQI